ncbi:hypothetical protein EDM56_05830 [Brevibacillus fluminis]|uniref:Uncharacterized protein n=1 Tax=Brevibacillus fluminis TaxID=511487 RepID=A0A3M8DT46_9BACL|nr:hypothetical protein [Brevibacillus fluminis]RNB91104.1 hypothetical protein EDM56_05830 [Brevibacillus fluminis]
MRLGDALFNWLQIQAVADARPHDQSAKETAAFFSAILTEDHNVTALTYTKDETMYTLRYTMEGKPKMEMYQIEAVEELLDAINSEPKYNQ